MRVLIDNQDGLGSLDYTSFLLLDEECSVTQKLNEPTMCELAFSLGDFAKPSKGAHVQVNGRDGLVLFSGTVISEPQLQSLGAGAAGQVFAVFVAASSNDVLANVDSTAARSMLLRSTGAESWSAVESLASGNTLSLALNSSMVAGTRLELSAGSTWAEIAETLGNATLSSYSVTGDSLTVRQIGQVVHTIAADDPGLRMESPGAQDLKWLAQDVTVCGHEEPNAYVTEVFAGDGSTSEFTLSEKPFDPVAAQKVAILDLFQGTSVNAALWQVSDAGQHISLGPGGLTCGGGSGKDAEATVASVENVELGGVVTLQGRGVQVSSGSAGGLLGLYSETVEAANCIAGFAVSSDGSEVSVAAVMHGEVVGSSFTLQDGHVYTLTLRLFAPEMERVRQTYFYLADDGMATAGGASVATAGMLQLMLQDVTSGMAGASTLLYSGSVENLPPLCVLGLLDSGSMACSIQSVSCTQTAPLWVAVSESGGAPASELVGSAAGGGSCEVTTEGELEFYAGYVPSAGALIYVNYRTAARSVARRAAVAGSQPLRSWIGTISSPSAWSSVDCDAAATALLATASSSATGVKGSYQAPVIVAGNVIQPGDALLIESASETSLTAVVREVKTQLRAGEVLSTAQFANDWVDAISLKISSSVPAEVVLPTQPGDLASALQSLSGLSVAAATSSVLSLSMGVSAPVNGGFEVRRRDNTFGPGDDSDLVVRFATESVDLPRAAAVEQYYLRMYDGSNPPNYSLLSAAVFVNLPI